MNSFEYKPNSLVALTGASGFIGRALLDRLLDSGWHVRILTRESKKWVAYPRLDIFEGDLVETRDWSDFLLGVDILIHAAGEIRDPDLMTAVNVEGSKRLLKAAVAGNVRRWIQISSVGAYGTVFQGCVDEDTPENPVGAYEKTKTQFDQLLREVCEQSALEVCIIRPSNVYGPNMVNQSLFQMMRMIQRGWFSYIGPPGALVNYIHVDDIVHAIILILQSDKIKNKTFIVSDSESMENFVSLIASVLNARNPNFRINLQFAFLMALIFQCVPKWPLRPSRVAALSNRSWYCAQKIKNELGWSITVPLSKGIKELSQKVKR